MKLARATRLKRTSTAGDREKGLPHYANPPVDESVLSIQFAPIPKFGIPHFGLYWANVRSEYPRFEVQPPIEHVTEQFEPPFRGMQAMGLQFVTAPEVRCWFLDSSGNRLFQVQRDRFIHNWRRLVGDEVYPRYKKMRESLQAEWLRFCDFLSSENLGVPKVNQCEVTYINHIEYDNGWKGYGDLDKVIAAWAKPVARGFLPLPERVNMEVHYRWSDDSGRLHVSLHPVIRVRDGKEALQLTLVARGAPKSSTNEDVFRCLDLAREWVVKGFADFTTEAMQKDIWGRI